MTVGALVAATGLRQANASKHLRQPHALALAGRRKEGRFVHYSLADDAVFRRCELTYGRVGAESRASSELLAV
jgi:DNA-binding transcriptional ArsR family regulator